MEAYIDPNLIHVDWERTFEAITLVIIFAFVVERALAVFFESRVFIEKLDRDGLKELIAILASIFVCVMWKLDAPGMFMLTTEKTTIPGYILTGLVVAGGSKASIKLFHDLLGVKASAYDKRHEIRAQAEADRAEDALQEANETADPRKAQEAARKAEAAVQASRNASASASSVVAERAAERAKDALVAAKARVRDLTT